MFAYLFSSKRYELLFEFYLFIDILSVNIIMCNVHTYMYDYKIEHKIVRIS